MPATSKPPRAALATRPALALLLLGHWLLLLAFSTSEKLHHSVCDRSQQPTHDCAFAAVAKSQLSTPLEPIQVPLPRHFEIDSPLQRQLSLPSIENLRWQADRGPPVNSLPT